MSEQTAGCGCHGCRVRIPQLDAMVVASEEHTRFHEERAEQAEAEVARLREALEIYANPQHWGISRDDLAYKVLSWIGPGALKLGLPDAMKTARDALQQQAQGATRDRLPSRGAGGGVSDAYFSPCRTWRYSLTRDVAPLTGEGTCTFVGLNPSTADETQDDPTIRRCIDFAWRWGYARLKMVNLYAFRTTDPRELFTAEDPIGSENDHVLSIVFGGSDLIVAAWGVNAEAARVAEVMAWPLRPRRCLGLTKGGAPRHPLYVPALTDLVPFQTTAEEFAA